MPWLATSYDAVPRPADVHLPPADGREVPNGQPMTSADVKFSHGPARDGRARAGATSTRRSRASAPPTRRPWSSRPSTSGRRCSPTSRCSTTASSRRTTPARRQKEFYTHPIGTGPFKWDHWTKGQELELVKNPHYWQPGKPLPGQRHLDDRRGRQHPRAPAQGRPGADRRVPAVLDDRHAAGDVGHHHEPVPVDAHRLPADERAGQAVRGRARPPGDLLRASTGRR